MLWSAAWGRGVSAAASVEDERRPNTMQGNDHYGEAIKYSVGFMVVLGLFLIAAAMTGLLW